MNAGVKAGHGNAQLSVPLLFASMFPSWFAGIADAANVIGAPAGCVEAGRPEWGEPAHDRAGDGTRQEAT